MQRFALHIAEFVLMLMDGHTHCQGAHAQLGHFPRCSPKVVPPGLSTYMFFQVKCSLYTMDLAVREKQNCQDSGQCMKDARDLNQWPYVCKAGTQLGLGQAFVCLFGLGDKSGAIYFWLRTQKSLLRELE